MSFSSLKSASGTSVEKLNAALKSLNDSGASYKDARLWYPELEKNGTGYAVIRFLPPIDGEEIPWIRKFNHGFKGPGGWFIEPCATTVGGECSLCAANRSLWNSGNESDKKIASERKRKISYYSNVIVLSDPKHPENEGKVWLFRYGQKIHDKIKGRMEPEFKDEVGIDPFDFWKGANFRLKIRKVAGQTNYDTCTWDAPSALFDGDDAKLEALWKSQYPLLPLISEGIKTPEDFNKRLAKVLSSSAPVTKAENTNVSVDAPAASTKKAAAPVETPSEDGSSEDTSDAMSFYQKLAEAD